MIDGTSTKWYSPPDKPIEVYGSKIALAGYHGAGKSCLATKISKLLNIQLIPEFARELLECTEFDWREGKDIHDFETAILSSHLFAVSHNKEFVADRTIVDIIGYYMWHLYNGRFDCMDKFGEFVRELAFYSADGLYDTILVFTNGYGNKDECGRFVENFILNCLRNRDFVNIYLKSLKCWHTIGKGNELVFKDFGDKRIKI